MDNKKIDSIDFIRAMSVLFIIIFHYAAVVLYDKKIDIHISRYIFPFMGGLGVSFFIVISGGGIYNSIKSHFSPLVFYKRRLLSIFPTYYVAYLITALCLFLFTGRVVFQGDISRVIWTILGLDGFLSQKFQTYYLIGEWFIGFIVFMYLLFPLIKFFYVKNSFLTFLFAVIISALSIHYNNFLHENIPLWNKRDIWNPTARLPEFVMGMILFEAIADRKTRLLKILLLVSIAVICGYALHDHRDMVINEYRNIPVFMSSLILLVILYQYGLAFLHGNNIISFLSKYSFLAFLYHHQILSVISMKINFYQFDRTGLVFCCVIAITLSFILAYGTFSVSQNFKKYLERICSNNLFVK